MRLNIYVLPGSRNLPKNNTAVERKEQNILKELEEKGCYFLKYMKYNKEMNYFFVYGTVR